MAITKILQSYLAFKRVSKQSDKPFSIHARKLAKVINEAINSLDGSKRSILTNQYLTPKKHRKTRVQYCKKKNITIEEYITLRQEALNDFERHYYNQLHEL
ncbi:hypothetical protein [Streptococcus pseudoporcinus]|uniref:Uncharacterized protein n=1 Tax=Streptococcus pseudoporcinus LQ 940-04 TaxID=875093 RepID=G5K854_9STRE|nr:hypothetical protein [Streptococcus pseudoporcinus]QBX10463.1 hypothetical protein JavanS441_0003 [Streptococcus satellite phage Javan441]QBX10482.1 hypothetical protein JavanS442_0003 [Streptococcus satellite phage Javan442]EFR44896.1 hypothetical protein HMPREF9320_0975 [Streptococcus pseudoporcinus SPIN 20026]EHI64293.1 hypothetical protein STRPS_1127 [Streptococcus pseudoporcinus LQ 940-04]VEF94000.1 Uncharacterised protein [Streptococcus pseudoporcinus]